MDHLVFLLVDTQLAYLTLTVWTFFWLHWKVWAIGTFQLVEECVFTVVKLTQLLLEVANVIEYDFFTIYHFWVLII